MAIFGPRVSLGCICFLFVAVFSASTGISQAKGADAAEFTSVVIPTGSGPDALAAADVNRDGAMDIIAANLEQGTVSVLLGDAKGHFHHASGSPFPAGHLPSDLGTGDFNGDGFLDLLIANHQTPYVTLLLGNGAGGFSSAPHSPFATNAKPHPHGLAVGHFCGSGEPLDAVIDSWASQEIELLIGDGKGNLRNGRKFPAGPGSDMPLRSADLNRDGMPDIVMPDTAIGQWNANSVSVLLGDGKCGFKAPPGSPFSAGAVPWSVAIGDINRDGIPDLVLTPYGPQVKDARQIAVTVLLGDGRGAFRPMRGSPLALPGCASPLRVAIGSLYGNGTHDFAVTCLNSTNVLLFRPQKEGLPRLSSLDVPAGTQGSVDERGVIFADILGRGRDDIIVSNGSAGTITLLLSK
jgi:FG-GAP-like repeat